MSEMIKGFAQLFNITYSILQVNDTTFEPSKGLPGLIQHVVDGECDALINYAITPSRLKFLDVSHPYLYMPISFLIPMPTTSVSISAVFESIHFSVWIGYFVSMILIIFFLKIFNRYITVENKMKAKLMNNLKLIKSSRLIDPTFYVIGLILNQARFCSAKKVSIRLVAGAWCFSAFVLLSLYNQQLISYITFNRPVQLIYSAEDLVRRQDVHLLVEEGLNVQAVLQSATTGLLKELGDKLRSYPNSGCRGDECVRMIKSGSHAYSMPIDPYLYSITRNDYRATGRCDFLITNNAYMDLRMVWGLPKRSPYMDEFNRGTMIMRQAGLVVHWLKMFRADAGRCLAKAKEITSFSPETSFAPLTLTNLHGAFVVLAVGYLAAFLVFIAEKIWFCLKKK